MKKKGAEAGDSKDVGPEALARELVMRTAPVIENFSKCVAHIECLNVRTSPVREC